MSLEPNLPFEFVVRGTAISLQGSARSQLAWREKVRSAARSAMPQDAWLLAEPLAITIFIFPAGKMQGDIDNRAKPVLDALSECLYVDDQLVERLVVQKFEPDRVFSFQAPSHALQIALEATEPVVYIRVTDDLHEELG